MFTQCFVYIFTSDGNGGHYIEKSTADTTLQSAIYHFTDNYWPSGAIKTLTEKVKSYDGPEIPDDGYQIERDGKIITFHFAVMEPQKEDQQSFFSYKLEVTDKPTHEHTPSTDWEYDDDNHWHECKCGEKDGVAKHTPSDGKCITCGTEIKENEKEPGGGIDLDEILGMLPEIDLDSILGTLPEINLDGILGIIPGFGDNSSTPETDKETDTEIPETGSDSSIIFVFITLSVSIITVSAVTLHRKKKISDK